MAPHQLALQRWKAVMSLSEPTTRVVGGSADDQFRRTSAVVLDSRAATANLVQLNHSILRLAALFRAR